MDCPASPIHQQAGHTAPRSHCPQPQGHQPPIRREQAAQTCATCTTTPQTTSTSNTACVSHTQALCTAVLCVGSYMYDSSTRHFHNNRPLGSKDYVAENIAKAAQCRRPGSGDSKVGVCVGMCRDCMHTIQVLCCTMYSPGSGLASKTRIWQGSQVPAGAQDAAGSAICTGAGTHMGYWCIYQMHSTADLLQIHRRPSKQPLYHQACGSWGMRSDMRC